MKSLSWGMRGGRRERRRREEEEWRDRKMGRAETETERTEE